MWAARRRWWVRRPRWEWPLTRGRRGGLRPGRLQQRRPGRWAHESGTGGECSWVSGGWASTQNGERNVGECTPPSAVRQPRFTSVIWSGYRGPVSSRSFPLPSARCPHMHTFSPFDLGGLVAVCWVFVKVLGPVAVAVAKRIEGRPQQQVADDPAVYQMQRDVEELQERVD